jgi:putative SOS response-associated peptidase YedK
MCGRFQITVPWSALVGMYGLADAGGPQTDLPFTLPRPNVAPTDFIPLVRRDGGPVGVEVARWGFPATWMARQGKDPFSRPLVNAKSEEAAGKPTWRRSLRERRGLVPMSAFIEWKREGRKRWPLRFHREDGAPLAVAALWGDFTRGEDRVRCVSLLTTAASAPVSRIHDRMPVILPEAAHAAWLDPETPAETVQALMQPLPDGALVATPLHTGINRVGQQDMALMEADWPGLEPA